MPSKSDNIFTRIKENVMGTEEENRKGQADLDKQATEGSKMAKFLGGKDTKEPVKKAKGGKVSSASSRADGCATKGKTKGRFV